MGGRAPVSTGLLGDFVDVGLHEKNKMKIKSNTKFERRRFVGGDGFGGVLGVTGEVWRRPPSFPFFLPHFRKGGREGTLHGRGIDFLAHRAAF